MYPNSIPWELFLWTKQFQANLDLDDDLAQDDLDELEQDEALLREIEELQLVNRFVLVIESVL